MTHLIEWRQTRQICERCGGLTEEGMKQGIQAAERCPRCRWEVGVPDWKPRPFGLIEYKIAEQTFR